MNSRHFLSILTVLVLGAGIASHDASAQSRYQGRGYRWGAASTAVPAGTNIDVRLDTQMSTEHLQSGDTWSGTVARDVMAGDRVAIPAGSEVNGVVTNAAQGTHSTPAELDLAL